jgi:hypothetical protein
MLLWRISAYGLAYAKCTCLIYRVPDLKTVLIYNDVSTEVTAGNYEQEDVKRQIKIMRNKETKQTQQNAMLQKLRSYKSHQSENTNMCSEKAKNS